MSLRTLLEQLGRATSELLNPPQRHAEVKEACQRAYSGETELFDYFVLRGCEPDAFNRAAAWFMLRYPDRKMLEAIKHVGAQPTDAERYRTAVALFGRHGSEIAIFGPRDEREVAALEAGYFGVDEAQHVLNRMGYSTREKGR
jgi:hypothetical protein